MVRSTVFPAAAAVLLLAAPAASAAPIDDAALGLRSAAVWLDPAAGRQLDIAALTQAIGGEPIKIAILPAGPSVSEVSVLPRKLAADLPGNTIAVIAGRYFYAGSAVLCDGEAGRAASGAINANETVLDSDENSDLTKALTDFVTTLRAAPKCEGQPGRGDRYADSPDGGEATGVDDTASVLPFVAGGVGLGALAVGVWIALARRRSRASAESVREQAHALVARLGGEVAGLPPDQPAAAGKHGEADALLLSATTDVQFAAVRRAAIEGLTAAREARVALGLPAGAEIPPLPAEPDDPNARVPADAT
ncbi:hypothetical protein [Actinokineospora sp.]|uniref:hypothetical protein n=1 Tax=Actinokineospora sp. TaxID=1872133 RepID=UPI00403797CB